MADWTDELKEEVVARYQEAEPTPENTTEIIEELAEEYEKSPNGVRMILSKAGVYVKKAGTKPSASSSKSTRVSKADEIQRLTDIIESQGLEADDAIISKLTGKAAKYFADTLTSITSTED